MSNKDKLLLAIYFILSLASALSYEDYLSLYRIQITTKDESFCKAAPDEDEELLYCGFYGLNAEAFDKGIVYTSVLEFSNLDGQRSESRFTDLELAVTGDEQVGKVFVSPEVTNITSGDDLAMRQYFYGGCIDKGQTSLCSKMEVKNIEFQYPFANKLIFIINDQRPQIMAQSINSSPIKLQLTVRDNKAQEVLQQMTISIDIKPMWQKLTTETESADLRLLIINISFFAVSMLLLFAFVLRRLQNNMTKQVKFNDILHRFESGAVHLQLYKDILPKGLLGAQNDQESQQLLLAEDDQLNGALMFDKEGESMDEELRKKAMLATPQPDVLVPEEEDGESVYSHYEEDAETGAVTRHLLKKKGAAHHANIMHAAAPPEEDEEEPDKQSNNSKNSVIAELSRGQSESPDKGYSEDMNNDLLDGTAPVKVNDEETLNDGDGDDVVVEGVDSEDLLKKSPCVEEDVEDDQQQQLEETKVVQVEREEVPRETAVQEDQEEEAGVKLELQMTVKGDEQLDDQVQMASPKKSEQSLTEAQGTQQKPNTIQASLNHSDLARAEINTLDDSKQSNKNKSKVISKQQSRVTSSKAPMDALQKQEGLAMQTLDNLENTLQQTNDSESKIKADMMTKETGDLTPQAVDRGGISIIDATKVITKDGKQTPQEGLLGNPPDYVDSEPPQDYDDIENMLGRSFDQIDQADSHPQFEEEYDKAKQEYKPATAAEQAAKGKQGQMYASYSQQKLAPATQQEIRQQQSRNLQQVAASNLTTGNQEDDEPRDKAPVSKVGALQHHTGAGKRPAKKNKFKLDLDTVKAPGKAKPTPLKHVQSQKGADLKNRKFSNVENKFAVNVVNREVPHDIPQAPLTHRSRTNLEEEKEKEEKEAPVVIDEHGVLRDSKKKLKSYKKDKRKTQQQQNPRDPYEKVLNIRDQSIGSQRDLKPTPGFELNEDSNNNSVQDPKEILDLHADLDESNIDKVGKYAINSYIKNKNRTRGMRRSYSGNLRDVQKIVQVYSIYGNDKLALVNPREKPGILQVRERETQKRRMEQQMAIGNSNSIYGSGSKLKNSAAELSRGIPHHNLGDQHNQSIQSQVKTYNGVSVFTQNHLDPNFRPNNNDVSHLTHSKQSKATFRGFKNVVGGHQGPKQDVIQ